MSASAGIRDMCVGDIGSIALFPVGRCLDQNFQKFLQSVSPNEIFQNDHIIAGIQVKIEVLEVLSRIYL